MSFTSAMLQMPELAPGFAISSSLFPIYSLNIYLCLDFPSELWLFQPLLLGMEQEARTSRGAEQQRTPIYTH